MKSTASVTSLLRSPTLSQDMVVAVKAVANVVMAVVMLVVADVGVIANV